MRAAGAGVPAVLLRAQSLEGSISLLIRLGGPNTVAVVYSKNVGGMNLLNHNGLDVRTQEEVDEAHRIVCAQVDPVPTL